MWSLGGGVWALCPCVVSVILQRTSHYSSFEQEGPSDERIVSPAVSHTKTDIFAGANVAWQRKNGC